MSAYYNEIDPFAAAWLRELIKAKLIADGEVDERSIADVRADDLRGFRQCHFFAGIGGWSYALRLAGWPDERNVWTGSCPCQPFSSAGAQAGGHDSRDLWPVWFQLIAECRPHVVFGEQVEAAIGHGWLDRLCDDLESEDYAIGPCGLPGPCVGAFDIRQRLWFVAESDGADQSQERAGDESGRQQQAGRRAAERAGIGTASRDGDGSVAQSSGAERGSWRPECSGADRGGAHAEPSGSSHARRMADAEYTERRSFSGPVEDERHGRDAGRSEAHGQLGACRAICDVADAESERGQRLSAERRPHIFDGAGRGEAGELGDTDDQRSQSHGQSGHQPISARWEGTERRRAAAGVDGFWSACDWLPCADGKARPVEPGTFPLAHGVSARVGRLRGYGNAIKPQLAAAFIEAYLSIGASE